MATNKKKEELIQIFIHGAIGAIAVMGLYILAWIINNPWMVGF